MDKIDNSKPRYPCNTIADMSKIPAEALPRFLSELPALLASVRQMQEAAEAMADRARWPWPLSLLPEGFRRHAAARSILRADLARFTWVDDNKGLLNVRMKAGSAEVFNETRKMNPNV